MTNEMCRCGHLGGKSQNSDHSDHYQKGHGKCNKCDCVKFTWVKVETFDIEYNSISSFFSRGLN